MNKFFKDVFYQNRGEDQVEKTLYLIVPLYNTVTLYLIQDFNEYNPV